MMRQKSASPQYTVGAIGACNLWGAPGTTFADWTLNYLNGEQKFDNLILHPYMGVDDDVEFGSMGNTSSDARSAQAYRINRMRGLVTGERYIILQAVQTKRLKAMQRATVITMH